MNWNIDQSQIVTDTFTFTKKEIKNQFDIGAKKKKKNRLQNLTNGKKSGIYQQIIYLFCCLYEIERLKKNIL